MTTARVTQEAVLVLHGGNTSDSRVTQEAVLVLHGGITSDARVTQEAVLVLHALPGQLNISVAGGNHPICDRGNLASGQYDYCILLGGDPSTATFAQAGVVNLNNGEGTIPLTGIGAGETIILVIQVLDRLGAYIAVTEAV